tara:strand:+ start:1519 stop:2604 length:1086 start_codon:yes stop_codon:yes gene_type:complete
MPKAAQNFPNADDLNDECGEDLRVCECVSCGLVQLDNEPVPYYKEVIRASAFSEEMRQFRSNQFKEFVKKYSLKNKKVIEIGCGKGEFVSLMRDAGTNAYGIEYSPESVEECRKSGLNVTKHYIEDSKERLPNSPYDCFFIMNFFEHLPDPNSVLRALHNSLSDDGLGLIEVPNFDMIIRNNLFSEFISDHLFYFSKDTLRLTLERNGFEIVECEEVWHDYIISAVVRKRKRTSLKTFQDQQVKIKNEIHKFIDNYGSKKIAVYGAGHQALAIMSLTNMGNRVKYVVDDAPFKQNKYTPATHVPIVPESRLKEDPVDAIIVMAASYSDEVARKLEKKYKHIDYAILRDFGLEKAGINPPND